MIRIGTGGNPLSTKEAKIPQGIKKESREAGIYRIKELNLDHIEIEFVHGVRIKDSALESLKKVSKELGISLTSHGSYYINLASLEKSKYYASQTRVKNIIKAGALMNAKSVTFHPAFYQERSSSEVSQIVKKSMIEILSETIDIYPQNHPIVSLETTGKISQWGDLKEIVEVTKDINNHFGKFISSVCVDFAHLQARTQIEYSKQRVYDQLDLIEKSLGKESLNKLHMHLSGIQYSEKGERKHEPIEKSNVNYKDILKVLKSRNLSGWLVCESPILEKDAKLLQSYYNQI